MANRPAPVSAEKSLGRLLLELLWQLLALLLPIFFVTLLPPPLALLVVASCALLAWLSARLGWSTLARGWIRLLISAVFGLGFSLGRALPAYWDIAAAFVSIVAGMAGISSLERRLGLARVTQGDDGGSGPSAWGGNEPQVTPEGEPIRVFNQGEIAMGGPTYCDYLFPDGVLLEGLGASARFSEDGRYFAAPVPSRQNWGLVILDRQQRRVYHCAHSEFWELDRFDAAGLGGRYSPLVDNGTRQDPLQDLLQGARAVDLVPIADLWLEPGAWQQAVARVGLEEHSPEGKHCLTGQIALPDSLRTLERPLEPLRSPRYHLSLDGQPSGLLLGADSPRVWSAAGDGFACLADDPASDTRGYWLWQLDRGWRALPEPWQASPQEPSFYWYSLPALDHQHLRFDAYLDCAQPDYGTYGYQLQSIHGDTQTQVGHDALGRVQVADLPLARIRLVLPLDSQGQRGSAQIESQPLLDEVRARFSWLSDNPDGLGGYQCQIGDWSLPGSWLLDHRVSTCQRYLALLPFTQAPAVAGQVLVADVQQRRLIPGPPMLAARILDFRDARLSLALIAGRLDQSLHSHPLQRCNQPAGPAETAASFCRYREDSRLYYQVATLQIEAGHLQRLPDWRRVQRPQAAVADGDFIQPSPGGEDAAWLFGCQTEYADSWLRPSMPRLGGHLLTASGCALKDLAPSMIWSGDGRYLALTRLLSETQGRDQNGRGWQLLLLDVRERSLRIAAQPLHNRPQFETFVGDRLSVRLFERDWQPERDGDSGHLLKLDLAQLLSLPAEPLIEHHGLWLRAADQAELEAWQALPRPDCIDFTGPAARR